MSSHIGKVLHRVKNKIDRNFSDPAKRIKNRINNIGNTIAEPSRRVKRLRDEDMQHRQLMVDRKEYNK